MIEWKEKARREVLECKTSTDDKWELNFLGHKPHQSPFFFVAKELVNIIGFGHGKTEIEAITDCIKSTEAGIEKAKAAVAELKAILDAELKAIIDDEIT